MIVSSEPSNRSAQVPSGHDVILVVFGSPLLEKMTTFITPALILSMTAIPVSPAWRLRTSMRLVGL